VTEIIERRYYRPDELAKEFGVHVETVRRWLRENRVLHLHLPGEQVIPHDEFHRTLKSGPRPRQL
jgi:excisionase family DNA binding protein